MSRTINIGVVSRSSYNYMAIAMAESLSKCIRAKRVMRKFILRGVLSGACRFFSSGNEVFKKKIPSNPLASINNYIFAADSLQMTSRIVFSQKMFNEKFAAFEAFLNSLKNPRKLENKEMELAKELTMFFVVLGGGTLQRYEKFMKGDYY